MVHAVGKRTGATQAGCSWDSVEFCADPRHPGDRCAQVDSFRTEHRDAHSLVIHRCDVELCIAGVVDLDHRIPGGALEVLP